MIAIATAVMYAMVSVAAVTDVRWGKVPNVLTVPCAVAGIALNALDSGLVGVTSSLAGIGIAIAVWLVLPLIGNALGGGDIKLFAAIGALRGHVFLLYAMAFSVLWAGLIAVCLAVARRTLLASCREIGHWAYGRACLGGAGPLPAAAVGLKVPFALGVALGAVTTSLVLR